MIFLNFRHFHLEFFFSMNKIIYIKLTRDGTKLLIVWFTRIASFLFNFVNFFLEQTWNLL